MAGERGLDGGAAGFEVADFADHHHVRVVTQDGAQPLLEGHAHRCVDRNLVHPGQVVFHRVLDCEHLQPGPDNGIQRRVERRRLARAGRPGDEENAVGPVNDALEDPERPLIHPELRQREKHVRLVEKTHDDALAEEHRDHAHAHVNLPPADVELDAPVLRDAALGDVEVRENLDAADDGRGEAVHLRRHGGFLQHAVNAVADRHVVLVRLDVNVARPLVDGFEDDLVDELDDAGLLRGFEQILAAGFERGRRVVLADHLVQRVAAEAVVGLDDLLNLVARGEHGLDVQPGEQAQVIERIQVKRIARRHLQDAVHAPDWHEPLPVNHARGQRAEQFPIERAALQRDDRQVQLVAENLEQLLLCDPTLLHHHAVQAQALGLGNPLPFLQLLGGEQAFLRKNVRDGHGRGWILSRRLSSTNYVAIIAIAADRRWGAVV